MNEWHFWAFLFVLTSIVAWVIAILEKSALWMALYGASAAALTVIACAAWVYAFSPEAKGAPDA